MNKLRKQSDATYPLFFLMVDSTDHVTGKTGLSPTVTISKNGGSFASPSGAVTEVGNGLYKVAGNATDSNTVGELWIHATGTAADPTDTAYTIVAYDPFDSVRLGLTALPNAAAAANGGLPTVNASNEARAIVYGYNTGQTPLQPTVAGRTLDVTVTGAAGIDWANVENPTTTNGLTGTTISTAQSVLITSGTGAGQLSVAAGVIKADVAAYSSGLAPLQPTVAGRTLDVTVNGEAGIDWGNIGSPTTPVNFSGTTINTATNVNDSSGTTTLLTRIPSALTITSGRVDVNALGTTAKADVNGEVLDVLTVDTFAEPASVPGATASLKDKIGWMQTISRNKITQTSTTQTLRNDGDSGNISTSAVSDDGTTFTRGKFA